METLLEPCFAMRSSFELYEGILEDSQAFIKGVKAKGLERLKRYSRREVFLCSKSFPRRSLVFSLNLR